MIIVPKNNQVSDPFTGDLIPADKQFDTDQMLKQSFTVYAKYWEALQRGDFVEYKAPVNKTKTNDGGNQ